MASETEAAAGPLYQTLAADLMAEIGKGKYAIGDLLPTEIELCERYSVSRFTVREALRWLTEAGLVTRRRGSGTQVIARYPTRRYTQPLGSIGDLLQYAQTTKLRVTAIERIRANAALAAFLPCAEGSEWVRVYGLRYDDGGRPICQTTVFLDGALDGVETMIGRDGPVFYDLIEKKFGLRLSQLTQRIVAVSLTDGQARRLDAAAGAPALRTIRRYYDRDGKLIEVSDSIHPGDRYTYEMRFDRETNG
jgi:DNA-binding GntR family transcriptional regulator